MPQDLLHKLIYALLSGLTAFLPVSSEPHQMLYSVMTGFQNDDVFLTMSIHLGMLVALVVCYFGRLKHLNHERRLASLSRRRRNRFPDPIALLDLQVLRTSAVPLLLSVVLLFWTRKWIYGILPMTITVLANSIILFLPRLLPSGDKDSRGISRLDSLLIGLGGALGAFPGVSRVGGMVSAGLACGIDRQYIVNSAFLLCIPATVGLIVLDIIAAVTAGAALTGELLLCLLTGALSFGGAMLSITLIRYLSTKTDFTGFRYYSFGLTLFLFILYLVI